MSLEEKRFTNDFFSCYFCFAWQHSPRIFECSRRMLSKNHLHVYVFREKKLYLFFFFPWLLFCLTAFSSNIRRVCCQSYVYVFLRLSVGSLSFCIYLFWLFCFFGGDSQLARAFDRQEPPTPHAFSGYVLCVWCIYYICKGVIYAGIYYDVIHTYWICIMYTM